MVEITNNELLNFLQSTAKLRAADISKFKISKTIVPVLETNPVLIRKDSIARHTNTTLSTASNTIYTAPATGNFYISSLSISIAKDAACDVAAGLYYVTTTINGRTVYLLSIARVTLSAQSASVSITFPRPIMIDKGASLAFGIGTFTAGTQSANSHMTGYWEE